MKFTFNSKIFLRKLTKSFISRNIPYVILVENFPQSHIIVVFIFILATTFRFIMHDNAYEKRSLLKDHEILVTNPITHCALM